MTAYAIHPLDWTGNPRGVRWTQTKLDGHRLIIEKDRRGITSAIGRSKKLTAKVKGLPWFDRLARELPRCSSIDGELIVPGFPNTEVSTALASDPARLTFVAFAVPFWGEADLFAEGLDVVAKLAESVGLGFAEFCPYAGESIDELKALARAAGVEGYVVKAANYLDWYRIKVTTTIDCIIIGTRPGVDGDTGSVEVGQYDADGCMVPLGSVAAGFNRAIRARLEVGQIIEIEYQTIGARGRMVHPRFLRLREDKTARECVAV